MNLKQLARTSLILMTLSLATGCGNGDGDGVLVPPPGGGGGGPTEPEPGPGDGGGSDPITLIDCSAPATLSTLDAEICLIKAIKGLTGEPEAGLPIPDIASDPLSQLGRDLFFTKALSGRGDVSCATCHDPRPPFFGSDGLSLSVGVNAINEHLVGPGRLHDPLSPFAATDPQADWGPNVPRRALTTFNTALYRNVIFFDGRLRWVDPGQPSLGMITPDAPMFDIDETVKLDVPFPLLQAQARRPVASQAEMRGFGVLPAEHGEVVRDYLAGRLGQYGTAAGELAGNDWNNRFAAVFGAVDPDTGRWLTYERIAAALAAYQASQLFVDSPWRDYIRNGRDVLTEQQKRGAVLFFREPSDGGAGCARCHSGDHFTDEGFHIVAVPQIGRGVGEGQHANDRGFGQHSWRREKDNFRFRTTSLLNVAHGSRFGHTGAWQSLEQAVRHHLDVGSAVDGYDWSLSSLEQFAGIAVSYLSAEQHTREAYNLMVQQRANPEERPLVDVVLADGQAQDLVAFLSALSDYRLIEGDAAAFMPWVASGTDPDGCRQGNVCVLNGAPPGGAPIWPALAPDAEILPAVSVDTEAYDDPASNGIRYRQVNDVQILARCTPTLTPRGLPAGHPLFDEVAAEVGLDYSHHHPDFVQSADNVYGVMQKLVGGVATADLDDDCFADIYLPRGDDPALLLRNIGGSFVDVTPAAAALEGNISSATFADLTGNGYQDLIVAGYARSPTVILPGAGAFAFDEAVSVTTPGSVQSIYSVTAGDYSLTGRLDLFASFWSASAASQQQYLWFNEGGLQFRDATGTSGLRGEIAEQFTFVGNFRDVTGNGWPDLLSVADFGRSQLFHNHQARFRNATRDSQITDENGMGTTFLDVNGDGHLDWFVTSIFAEATDTSLAITGNRMYLNDGQGNFMDATEAYGVRDGDWGWAACAMDFRNDGHEDIFQSNGWGHLRHPVGEGEDNPFRAFLNQRPNLFLRADGGAFADVSAQSGLIPGEGRGIVCADFDRDGAVDVLVVNNNGPVHFYRNNARELFPDHEFLSVRLRHRGPNWEGVGARVWLTLAGPDGERTLMRDLGGNNYLSQNPVEAHFGLGVGATLVSLRVEWPAVAVDGVVYRDVSMIDAADLTANSIIDVIHPECDVAGRCGPGP
ncbi:MAG: FG-GAP-like repeat-containing protein [Alcanivoracaceae bacterium]